MKRDLLYMMLLIFIISGKLNAQNFKIHNNQRYFNYLTLKQVISNEKGFEKQKDSLLNVVSNESFNLIEFNEKIKNSDKELWALSNNLIQLSKTFSLKGDSATIDKYYFNNIFSNDSYPALKRLSYTAQDTIIRKFINYLNNDLNYTPQKTPQSSSFLGPDIDRFLDRFLDSLYLKIAMCLLIVAVIIYLIFLSINYRKNVTLLDKQVDELDKRNHDRDYSFQNKINSLRNDLSEVRNSVNELEKYNHKSELAHSSSYNNGDSNYLNSVHESSERIHKSEHIKYFFSTPNDDGSFLDRNKSNSFEQYSNFYLFEIDANNQRKAIVTIVDDNKTQKHILNNYKEYLDAVCTYKNAFFKSATKIITEDPGIAYLEDDKWIIKESDKIKIKFL